MNTLNREDRDMRTPSEVARDNQRHVMDVQFERAKRAVHITVRVRDPHASEFHRLDFGAIAKLNAIRT